MAENLQTAFAIVILIPGWALIIYAGYLSYAALPGEHAPRHVITRGALAAGGLGLVIAGIALIL